MPLNFALAVGGITVGTLVPAYIALYLFPNLKSVPTKYLAKKAKWHLPVLGLLFGLTSVIGSIVGYFVALDTTLFYAFGVTSGIYAAIRLAGPLISNTQGSAGAVPSYLGAKTFLWVGIGFFLLYGAGLLH